MNPTIICGEKLSDPTLLSVVREIQEKLWDVGSVGPDNPFWTSKVALRAGITNPEDPRAKEFWVDGDPGAWTKEAVIHFQLRHIGPNKIPLDETEKLGTVGEETWWALEHCEGDSQHQWIPAVGLVSKGLGQAIVEVWEHYINKGLIEIPLGSNRGPVIEGLDPKNEGGIDVWTGYKGKASSIKGPAWCCWSRTGIERETALIVLGKDLYFQGHTGLCYANYQWGKKKGYFATKDDVITGRAKLPVGAAMIMNYGGTRGHTGTVAGIKYQGDLPVQIETREGNISDRGGRRIRSLKADSIKWFIISPEITSNNPDYIGTFNTGRKVSSETEKTS